VLTDVGWTPRPGKADATGAILTARVHPKKTVL
jgi:hypothetical protein